jgi:hypothetical protein
MSWGLKSSYTAKEFFNRTSLLMITDGIKLNKSQIKEKFFLFHQQQSVELIQIDSPRWLSLSLFFQLLYHYTYIELVVFVVVVVVFNSCVALLIIFFIV